jgi:hypothetical protein
MATPKSLKPENRNRKKKKPPQKFRVTYSLGLLVVMLFVGGISGLFAYNFGKQALEGVNPAPAGIKLPKANPNLKDSAKDNIKNNKPDVKPTPAKQSNAKDFLLLDESQIIAEFKTRSQQELGNIRRPVFAANANLDRRAYAKTYVNVDRAFTLAREPLAVSASADQRIADRIAELRQRVYVSSRSYDNENFSNRDRLGSPVMTQSVTLDRPLTPLLPVQSSVQLGLQQDLPQGQFKPRKAVVELMPSDLNSYRTDGRR